MPDNIGFYKAGRWIARLSLAIGVGVVLFVFVALAFIYFGGVVPWI